jgi:DNA-binding transcriptional MerR regulator
MRSTLRPVELGRAVGISAATVRMYEREGILPEAERTPSGHRRYTFRHLQALETARSLMRGYGWEYASQVMRTVHAGQIEQVHVLVDARHAAIDRERQQLSQTMRAFEVLTGTGEVDRSLRVTEGMKPPVRVGEAARQAGVPVSTVHFWEQQQLLSPQRDRESNYRLYSANDIRVLQVIAMLRDAGYRFGDMRSILRELGEGNPAAALVAMQKRQKELHAASRECMAATAALWRYLDDAEVGEA